MSRKSGSNGYRLDQHDKEILALKQNAEEAKQHYEQHIERHILDDLSAERFPGSCKPMYSYSDIAERHGVSTSKVQRVAEENNLTRRNKKIG